MIYTALSLELKAKTNTKYVALVIASVLRFRITKNISIKSNKQQARPPNYLGSLWSFVSMMRTFTRNLARTNYKCL